MKIFRKRTLILSAVVLFILWLVIPRYSTRWNIAADEKMMEGKSEYLKNRSTVKRSSAPNILIILADDLSRNDLTLYDKVHGFDTPSIEALADEGVVFESAMASAPICSPSRAGMLTGRVQNRSGFDSQPMQIYPVSPLYYYGAELFVQTDAMSQVPFGTYPFPGELKKQGIPQSEIMLPEILKSSGYSTGLSGKWHLGYGQEQSPEARGFDFFYGFLEAFTWYDDPSRADVVSYRHDLFWEKHIWNQKRKGPSAIQLNGTVIKENRHLTDAITEESLSYLDNYLSANPDSPFFLYASYNAPHTPFQELEKYYELFPYIKDKNRRIYAALIAHLDDAVGELLEGLKERGIYDNTLIVFASDNGGASYTGATTNGDLAGGKMSQFQGGLEIPMIIKWPGHGGPTGRYSPMVSLMDVFSTALGAVAIPLPRDRVYDGVDLMPYVKGETDSPPHRSLFWKSGFNSALIRDNWKLLINNETGETLLYNLDKDRGEYVDLSKERPEVLKDLMKELRDREKECKPPLWPRVMNFDMEVHGKTYRFAI